jgi:hypothetical protein
VNASRQRGNRWANIAACLAGIFLATILRAQEAKRELLVEHVPPSILAAPATTTNAVAFMEETQSIDGKEPTRLMKQPSREMTQGERWEEFETEFGLVQKNPSSIKGSLESAKYRLDKTVFQVNELVQNVENALSFDYGLRPADGRSGTNTSARSVSTSPIPLWNVVENARFKSDIDLNMPGGRAFVGVRLVLPIGD